MTVIDYYARYLLACHLTYSYSAVEVAQGLKQARAEAERICQHSLETDPPTIMTN